jgi:hypothetical protein
MRLQISSICEFSQYSNTPVPLSNFLSKTDLKLERVGFPKDRELYSPKPGSFTPVPFIFG